uniref:Si:dkey-201c13.2 n=1 Tax=Stegastes partitus TaxID=144197 RepID=A0A3B5BFR4_9TELE
VLLDLTGCGGSSLAAHAGGIDCFRGDQIQILIIGNLIEPVPVLQELDVQVLVDLL